MNIKVAVFTVSEKSSNTLIFTVLSGSVPRGLLPLFDFYCPFYRLLLPCTIKLVTSAYENIVYSERQLKDIRILLTF